MRAMNRLEECRVLAGFSSAPQIPAAGRVGGSVTKAIQWARYRVADIRGDPKFESWRSRNLEHAKSGANRGLGGFPVRLGVPRPEHPHPKPLPHPRTPP